MELTRKDFLRYLGAATIAAGCGDSGTGGAGGGTAGSPPTGGSPPSGGNPPNGGSPPEGGNGGNPPEGGSGGTPPEGGSGGTPPEGGFGGSGGSGGEAPVDCSDATETIGANHGHVLTVTQAEITAAIDKVYDITGAGDHGHTVTLTAANFATLAAGGQVNVVSSLTGHTHNITVVCA